MTTTMPEPRIALLCVNSHKDQPPKPVKVLETYPKRVKIEALTMTILGGRNKILQAGETALVPLWCIKYDAAKLGRPSKKAKVDKIKFWRAEVQTTKGIRIRYYRAQTQSGARSQADKIGGLIQVGKVEEITETQYTIGRASGDNT